MRDYACTLLVAILTEKHATFFQIGDGAIVCRDQEPEWSWVFWPQHGPYVNTTYFVTEDSARDQLEFSSGPNRITEIAVFSDGLENLALHHPTRTTYDPFFDRMFKPLRSSEVIGCDQSLSKLLQDYLSSPAVGERTNDDVTLVLASRFSPQPTAASSPDSEPVHGSSD